MTAGKLLPGGCSLNCKVTAERTELRMSKPVSLLLWLYPLTVVYKHLYNLTFLLRMSCGCRLEDKLLDGSRARHQARLVQVD